MISEEPSMNPATHSLPETVVPPSACDYCQTTGYYESAIAEEQGGTLMPPIHRTILHAAIRIGQCFELVFECRQS
jgi:hypothetical protein